MAFKCEESEIKVFEKLDPLRPLGDNKEKTRQSKTSLTTSMFSSCYLSRTCFLEGQIRVDHLFQIPMHL